MRMAATFNTTKVNIDFDIIHLQVSPPAQIAHSRGEISFWKARYTSRVERNTPGLPSDKPIFPAFPFIPYLSSTMYLAPIINHVLPFFLPNPPNRPESTSPQPGTLTFFPSRAHATHPDSLRLLWADPPPASSSSFSSRIGGNSLVSSPGGFVDQAASDLHNFVCSGRNSEDELSGRCDFSITTVPAQDQGIHLRTRNVTILRSRPRHNSTIHPFTHPTEYLAQRRSRRKEAKFQAAQGIPVTKYELEDDWIWEEEEVVAPDTRDRETLLTLAKMTSNAYTLPESSDWYPLERWNDVSRRDWISLASEAQNAYHALHSFLIYIEHSLWLGKRRRWSPRSHILHSRQFHRHHLSQRDLCRSLGIWRSHGEKR